MHHAKEQNERFKDHKVCLGRKRRERKKAAPLFIRSFRRGQKRRKREMNMMMMMMRMILGCTQNAKMPTPERGEIPKITV
jgi:hypothetical protein